MFHHIVPLNRFVILRTDKRILRAKFYVQDSEIDLEIAWPDGSRETVRTPVDRLIIIQQK